VGKDEFDLNADGRVSRRTLLGQLGGATAMGTLAALALDAPASASPDVKPASSLSSAHPQQGTLMSQPDSSTPPSESTPANTAPTIVLVHGAWADATGFDAEIRALRDGGYSVVGFGNPLRDLAGDSAYLAEFLGTLSGPIVLVGHSYGGNVISMAAIGNDQVKALVYLNGWMCDEGETQQQLLEQFEGSLVGPSIRPVPFTNPDGSEGTDLYLAQEAFREAFAADVDPETAAVMAVAQRPYAVAAFAATPSAPPAWKTLPCWYLLGTEDKAIPPELQRFMAERANATIVEVPASHVSFVSQPEAATQLILQAVEATASTG
jgi:pimeloyl-ACP methyl ester carboxylesterase